MQGVRRVAVTVKVDGLECTVTMTDFRDGGGCAAARLEEVAAEAAKRAARLLAEARGKGGEAS